jgi:hypothetical protein
MILYVHAGTHKTATTAIQAFLWTHRALLEARGLYIPLAGLTGAAPEVGHHNVAWDIGGHAIDPNAGGVEALLAELAERAPERACISSEVFSTLYDMPDALLALRARFASIGAEIRPVLFFRPQAGYLEGLYAELVKHGLSETFERFLERAIEDGSIEFNDARYGFEYDRIADAFAGAFGRETLSILSYDDPPRAEETIERFLAIVAPGAVDLDLTALGAWERRNLSIGFRGVAEALVANREGGAVDDVLDELRPDGSVPLDGRFRPLGIADLARVLGRFGPNNRVLLRRYGADVPVWFAKRFIDQVRRRRLA